MATPADLAWWIDRAEQICWTWAVTYADHAPHWYVIRDKQLTGEEYERAFHVIRTYGSPEKFYNNTNVYLTDPSGRWKWWTYQLDGVVINMAVANEYYGEQDAPVTVSDHHSIYDEIATTYDGRYTDEQSQTENEWVRKLIVNQFGAYAPTTLDVGCGTGLLLDLGVTSPRIYTGIDPSQGMLNQLVLKHPKVAGLYPATAEEILPDLLAQHQVYELVVSLFASPSYMNSWCYEQMWDLTTRMLILMTYQSGAAGHFYTGQQAEQVKKMSTVQAAEAQAFAEDIGAEVTELGHFDVIVARR